MLVMRRRAGESFLVGDAVEIEVLEVCHARVKLGIVAPDSVLIQRKETQITRDENITAARSVRQQNISSLLNKVAFQPVGAPVKNLTDAAIIDNSTPSRAWRCRTGSAGAFPAGCLAGMRATTELPASMSDPTGKASMTCAAGTA